MNVKGQGAIVTGYDVILNNVAGREVPVSVSSAPIRGPGGGIVGAVIVCRDVSEMRRLQQAKDDFLSIASHELKTPLTSMRGYADLGVQHIMFQLAPYTLESRALLSEGLRLYRASA